MTHEEIENLLIEAEAKNNSFSYAEAEQICNAIRVEITSWLPLQKGEADERVVALLLARTLNVLAESFGKRGMTNEALPHAQSALANALRADSKEEEAKALNTKGVVYENLGDYPHSLECYQQSLAINTELGNDERIAKNLGNIGTLYFNISDYAKALEYHQKALSINEKSGRKDLSMSNLSNIGIVYSLLSEYSKSTEYMHQALAIAEEMGDSDSIGKILANLATTYTILSDYTNALEYYRRSLAVAEKFGSKSNASIVLGGIAEVYRNLSDYANALEYNQKALAIAKELGNKAGIARIFGNIGIVYSRLTDSASALEYFQKSLAINEEIGNKSGAANNLSGIGGIFLDRTDFTKALEYYQKSLAINEEIGTKQGIAASISNIAATYVKLTDYRLAMDYMQKALGMFEEIGIIDGVVINLCNIGTLYSKSDYEGFDAGKAEEILLKAIGINEEIGGKENLYECHQSLADVYEYQKRWEESQFHFKKFHELKEEVQSAEAKKTASVMEHRRQAAEREKEIEIERAKASGEKKILDNILPKEITARLINGENPIADHFDSVSVLFMDIVDFTPLATSITAQQLVHLLNVIFSAADGVMRECGLEKIKTIGDAYMAVAGAPTPCNDHAHRAANAALKLLDVMHRLVVTFPDSYGDISWIESIPEIQVRIGMHCGSAAAGVVGENKFLYDLWGDAVNTASRMESHGEPGKIHVTEEFMHAIAGTSHDMSQQSPLSLQFVERAEMEIKGKGIMKTYFLEKINTTV